MFPLRKIKQRPIYQPGKYKTLQILQYYYNTADSTTDNSVFNKVQGSDYFLAGL